MLYKLHETQRAITKTLSDYAKASANMLGNAPRSLNTNQFLQGISASYDLMHRLTQDYPKPSFGLDSTEVEGVKVVIHEYIEIDKPFCELRRFKRYTDNADILNILKNQPAVLLVAPLSGHYATLLRDTVKTMMGDHRVYITDWKNAKLVPLSEGEFHLDDYVNYVQEFIRHLQEKHGNCHVISVCQPTVPVLAATALMASRKEKTPLSITMMGGPIDGRKSPTGVNNLAKEKSFEWFQNNLIFKVPPQYAGAGRKVYPGFLQHSGFVAMNPERHSKSHRDYFKDLMKGDDVSTEAHRKFYDEYNAVLDMDADFYLDTIKIVFQDFNLPNGTWDVKSVDQKLERVRPQDITTSALLTIEGELDDISGAGQTEAAQGLCSNIPAAYKKHVEIKGAGHYGIFSGRKWRNSVYPVIKDFIQKYNQPVAASATKQTDKPQLPEKSQASNAPANSNAATAKPSRANGARKAT